jgi:uncharacterized protein (TIGR02246 family)
MTRRNVLVCAVALASVLAFFGCQTAPAPGQKMDVAADIKAINALNDKLVAAMNSRDAAALAACYADDAVMMDPDQAAVEGKPAIQAAYEARGKEMPKDTVTALQGINPLETQVAGDWAYQRGNYTVTITPKSGKPMEMSYKYLTVYKRQPDGSWKMYRDISNSNNPPPAVASKKKK